MTDLPKKPFLESKDWINGKYLLCVSKPPDIPGYMLGSMRRTEKMRWEDCIQEVVIKKGHFLKIITLNHMVLYFLFTCFSLPLVVRLLRLAIIFWFCLFS